MQNVVWFFENFDWTLFRSAAVDILGWMLVVTILIAAGSIVNYFINCYKEEKQRELDRKVKKEVDHWLRTYGEDTTWR